MLVRPGRCGGFVAVASWAVFDLWGVDVIEVLCFCRLRGYEIEALLGQARKQL
jgi:hypothetical protein